jgi:uncharacterized membrane protein YphA (DoxX/SURF4 family)
VVEVTEDKMNAVTAMSGSGPAYFFLLVEQMIAAGVDMGLSPQHARQLAAKTALGAAKMLATSRDDPAELRRKVTSPGGTTHAAITHMQAQNVPAGDRRCDQGRRTARARARQLVVQRKESHDMKALNNFLFGGAGATTHFGDLGLLIQRLGFGLAISIGHGMSKVYHDGSVGLSDQFLSGVKGMNFPAPTAMAWLAALTEFLGGLLIALGLMTRPVAIALAFNMGVAAFVAHKDAPLFSTGGRTRSSRCCSSSRS